MKLNKIINCGEGFKITSEKGKKILGFIGKSERDTKVKEIVSKILNVETNRE